MSAPTDRLAIMKAFLGCMGVFCGIVGADDWPQWMGPQRDGVWREEGVRTELQSADAKVLWRSPVRWGYAGPAVAGGKVYLPDFVDSDGDFDPRSQGGRPLEGIERVVCLDAETGKELWKHEHQVTYAVSYPGGPRITPTIHDGLLYFQGTMGHLWCLDAQSGEVKWHHDLCAKYQCRPPRWGYAAHPLIHGDLVYVTAGGKGSVLVAFNRRTGEEVWKALSGDEAGYCPPLVTDFAGVSQLLFWYPAGVASLNPATGAIYWELELEPQNAISRMTPRRLDDKLFVAGPGVGALFKLDSTKPAAEVVWRAGRNNSVFPLNSDPHLQDGVIYGVDGESSAIIAVSMESGERLWSDRSATLTKDAPARVRHGSAFLVHHQANDQFWIMSETGDLILANLDKSGYRELGRQHLLEPTNEAWDRKVLWSHPAFAHQSIFARNDRELIRVDLSADP
jgi:outer membrane protein assembly factor BamB